MIGIAKHNVWFEAANDALWNRVLKYIADTLWNHWFLKQIADTQDFIGLNHYNHHRIDGWYGKNRNQVQTDFGWEYYPESLYHALVELKPYNKPIYVTENGIADALDELRQKFIPAALKAMERAITDGTDVRGYFYWSLLDNFEWDKGYWLRFGLVAVDRGTQVRTVRPSAQIYASLIADARTQT
jgi:beta-glucosidase